MLAHIPITLCNGITPNNPTRGIPNPLCTLRDYQIPTTGRDHHSPLQVSRLKSLTLWPIWNVPAMDHRREASSGFLWLISGSLYEVTSLHPSNGGSQDAV